MPESQSHDDTTQAYGSLATRLHDALNRARAALQPHAGLLPGGTLADLDALLAEFERRRVRIALYGEVKAGKSTLLNALAAAELSPAAFDPLTSIPVRVTYGSQTVWRVGDQTLDSAAELARLMRETDTEAGEVLIETNLDLLQLGGQVDLLDTPGVGSEERYDTVTSDTLRSLDAVVLVVRYPALFTQFTRHLVEGMKDDIGKLFVVWNLDAACAELTPEERARHTETLRTAVAGARDLFLVDARAALQATRAGDAATAKASGLSAFSAALAAFASSGARDLAATREAGKRAQLWLADAQRALIKREAALDRALRGARQRIDAAQQKASTESSAAKARFADFEASLTRVEQESAGTTNELAADLRGKLRSARRSWIRRPDTAALEAAVAAAVDAYADSVESASQSANQAVEAEASDFGTAISTSPRARARPEVGPLSPEERSSRAARGRMQLLRRALFRRWYLPGLAALERTAITEDLAAQAAWLDGVLNVARNATNETLASRLEEISRRTDTEIVRIKAETQLSANEEEFETIKKNLPVLGTQLEAIAQVEKESRSLLRK